LRRPHHGCGPNRHARDTGFARSGPRGRSRPLGPSQASRLRPWRPLRRAGHRTEDDLNLHLVQISILKFQNLVKTFLADGRFGLFEILVLALDYRPPHGALAFLVALYASFKRHIEKHGHGRHLESFRQVE
jgi:hypothetical protein